MARFSPLPGIWAGIVDLTLCFVFAAAGRLSHSESLAFGQLFATWWPFAIAAAFGWVTCYALSVRIASIGGGIVTTVLCLALGMLLRWLSGQGIAAGFIAVAGIVLTVLLLGWRVFATIVVRRRRS